MHATSPSANGQPHTVQYTPAANSMENTVLAFVNPSSSSFPLPSSSTSTNLNFHSNNPSAPMLASTLGIPERLRSASASGTFRPSASTCWLKPSTRANTCACCDVPCGSRSRA
ncbi:MAG: hypothetical protein EOO71_38965 [Myxococcaceae bacterium]|nr:MAG: hypothetical protein EOO71_38965 [Myxococcaceae bacterium]